MTKPAIPPNVPRIVHYALLAAAAVFAVIVAVLTRDGPFGGEPIPELGFVGIALAIVQVPAALFQRRLFGARIAAAGDDAELATRLRLLATVVPMALLEIAVLSNCLAWLFQGTFLPNGAIAAAVLGIGAALRPF